jgi:GNAT superfamily N-acetyltransferase
MTESAAIIRALTPEEAHEHVASLADILLDCVAGGASVSFMAPLSVESAQAFWRAIADAVVAKRRALLIAEDRTTNQVQGTVQIILDQPENQPHRADIAKMLVHRRARRQGLAAALMRTAEATARAAGKTLLVLDTATGSDAERLYQRMGWNCVGIIPGYALWPDGRPCATTYYYKSLA